MKRIKVCDICTKPIDENTKYAKFKKNTLFTQVDGPQDSSIWHGLTSTYICASCLQALMEMRCNG